MMPDTGAGKQPSKAVAVFAPGTKEPYRAPQSPTFVVVVTIVAQGDVSSTDGFDLTGEVRTLGGDTLAIGQCPLGGMARQSLARKLLSKDVIDRHQRIIDRLFTMANDDDHHGHDDGQREGQGYRQDRPAGDAQCGKE